MWTSGYHGGVSRMCWVIASFSLVIAACSGDAARSGTGDASASGQARGTITVLAAASLTEAFTAAQTALHAEQPGVDVTFSFGASGTLVAQVQQGAPADVIATADTSTMRTLVDAGLVEPPVVFARNRLEIIVAAGNPKGIHDLADLGRTDISVVLADPSVPAGKYAAQVLTAADVTIAPKSLEGDVKAAVARVTSGEADAAIVYATDVRAAGDRATGVEIAGRNNVLAEYPIAIVKSTRNRTAAQRFVEFMTKGAGRTALEHAGFLSAP